MDSARWQKVQELFEASLAAGPEEGEKLLTGSGADTEVLETVAKMLRADADGGTVLDRGVPEVAYELLAHPEGRAAQPPIEEFGPYRIIRLLGEGGMGVVWLAERTDTGSQIAVKFLPNAGLSPARLDRFTYEIRLLARLKHPWIARFHDAGTLTDGTPWFVMEYVEGAEFNIFAHSLGSIEKKLRLFRSVCEAVQYAHSQALIHRDLKPSNVLVEADGTPKLLDFGIGRELRQPGEESGLTVRGPRFASPRYSSPEWIKDGEAGVTTDVYSLGVMLYEIIVGRLPDNEAKDRRDNEPIEKPSLAIRKQSASGVEPGTKNASISKSEWNDLDVLCLKGMHAEHAKRYGSVEALIRDIDHFLHGEPLEARPDSWGYRSGKFLRRKARAVTTIAAASVVIVGMAITFTVRLAQARNAALAEAARSDRMLQFTLSLFESSGNLSDSPGNLTVEMLVDRGVVDADRLNNQPKLQAGLYQTLGRMYQDMGKPLKADHAYSEALSILNRLPDSPVASRVDTCINLASIRSHENNPREGEKLMREAIQLIDSKAPGDLILRAKADYALGTVLTAEGRYRESEPLLKATALEQGKSAASQSDLANTLIALSNVELYLGHYDDSDASNKQLLDLYGGASGSNKPRIADALQNLGDNAEVRGQYLDAENYGRQAVAVAKAWYGPDHRATANKISSLATVLIDEGKLAEADGLLQDALAVEEKVYPPNSVLTAKTLRAKGMLQASSGNYNAAIKTFESLASIYRARFGENSYILGVTLLNDGATYIKIMNYSRAESLLQEALQILLKTRGETDVYTARVRLKLGQALLMQHRNGEAMQQTRIAFVTLKKLSPTCAVFLTEAQQNLIVEQNEVARGS